MHDLKLVRHRLLVGRFVIKSTVFFVYLTNKGEQSCLHMAKKIVLSGAFLMETQSSLTKKPMSYCQTCTSHIVFYPKTE